VNFSLKPMRFLNTSTPGLSMHVYAAITIACPWPEPAQIQK